MERDPSPENVNRKQRCWGLGVGGSQQQLPFVESNRNRGLELKYLYSNPACDTCNLGQVPSLHKRRLPKTRRPLSNMGMISLAPSSLLTIPYRLEELWLWFYR